MAVTPRVRSTVDLYARWLAGDRIDRVLGERWSIWERIVMRLNAMTPEEQTSYYVQINQLADYRPTAIGPLIYPEAPYEWP